MYSLDHIDRFNQKASESEWLHQLTENMPHKKYDENESKYNFKKYSVFKIVCDGSFKQIRRTKIAINVPRKEAEIISNANQPKTLLAVNNEIKFLVNYEIKEAEL